MHEKYFFSISMLHWLNFIVKKFLLHKSLVLFKRDIDKETLNKSKKIPKKMGRKAVVIIKLKLNLCSFKEEKKVIHSWFNRNFCSYLIWLNPLAFTLNFLLSLKIHSRFLILFVSFFLLFFFFTLMTLILKKVTHFLSSSSSLATSSLLKSSFFEPSWAIKANQKNTTEKLSHSRFPLKMKKWRFRNVWVKFLLMIHIHSRSFFVLLIWNPKMTEKFIPLKSLFECFNVLDILEDEEILTFLSFIDTQDANIYI